MVQKIVHSVQHFYAPKVTHIGYIPVQFWERMAQNTSDIWPFKPVQVQINVRWDLLLKLEEVALRQKSTSALINN